MVKTFIEQIEGGHKEIKLPLGLKLKETPDFLDISNGKLYLWIFSLVSGYRQLGSFPINRPHQFNEREWVDVDIKEGKIVNVKKLGG